MMEQPINYKLNTDSSNQSTQITVKPKRRVYEKCKDCNKRRKPLDESHQICRICYKSNTLYKPSGNVLVDKFMRYTQINSYLGVGIMEYVPYDHFTNIEFVAEGGFSKVYRATWIDGPISKWSDSNRDYCRKFGQTVAIKRLNNSKNITITELNELMVFYDFSLKSKKKSTDALNVNRYYGITQDPITEDFIIIMDYLSCNLNRFIKKNFYSISWHYKLKKLKEIIEGLSYIHKAKIIHRDFHSGNILVSGSCTKICDLGISKSSMGLCEDSDGKVFGIIPYVAPEILQGQKYTTSSDIYGFGMIMWELMTGRRPFWDELHDSELILQICIDGKRPSIVTTAPDGYIELMQECWRTNPNERPTANEIIERIDNIKTIEKVINTEILISSDVGPLETGMNAGAIYKSRHLDDMIESAMSTKNLSQPNTSNIDYITKELEFDILNDNFNNSNIDGYNYISKEIDFDI